MVVLFLSDAMSEQEDAVWSKRTQDPQLETLELPQPVLELLELLVIADRAEVGESLEQCEQLGPIAARLRQEELSGRSATGGLHSPEEPELLAVNRNLVVHTEEA